MARRIKPKKKKKGQDDSPVIENRRARYDYTITDTLETGIVLVGTEVKSIRDGQASLAEGFVRVDEDGSAMWLYQVMIPEYPPAGSWQHIPARKRKLLAHKKEMSKLLKESTQKGVTIVPLKMYFKNGWLKVQIGLAKGKGFADKRQDMAKRDAERDMRRAMARNR